MIIAYPKTAVELKIGDIFKVSKEHRDWFQCFGSLYVNAIMDTGEDGHVIFQENNGHDFEVEVGVPRGYKIAYRATIFLQKNQRIYVIDQTVIRSTPERMKLLYGRFINSS